VKINQTTPIIFHITYFKSPVSLGTKISTANCMKYLWKTTAHLGKLSADGIHPLANGKPAAAKSLWKFSN